MNPIADFSQQKKQSVNMNINQLRLSSIKNRKKKKRRKIEP